MIDTNPNEQKTENIRGGGASPGGGLSKLALKLSSYPTL